MLVSSVSVSVINFVFVCIILVFCALSENKKKNVKKKNVKKKKKNDHYFFQIPWISGIKANWRKLLRKSMAKRRSQCPKQKL